MSLGGKWFPHATESYLLPRAFAANQGSNFPSDHFMLQFYKIFCALWTQIWNWNSTFFYPGWWGGCLEMLLCWNGSPPSCRISAVGLWRKWKSDLNGLAATTHVRATFIPRLPALTCSNVILSAEARGVTTMLLSTFQLHSTGLRVQGLPLSGVPLNLIMPCYESDLWPLYLLLLPHKPTSQIFQQPLLMLLLCHIFLQHKGKQKLHAYQKIKSFKVNISSPIISNCHLLWTSNWQSSRI